MSTHVHTEIEQAEQRYRNRVAQAAAIRDKEVAAIMARVAAQPTANPNLAKRILDTGTHTSRILRLLHASNMTIHDLVRETGLDVQSIRTYLHRLRVDGAIVSLPIPGAQEKAHQLTAETRALMDRLVSCLPAAPQ